MLQLLLSKERGEGVENLLFTYNLVLTIVFTIVLTGFYILRVKHDKREYFFLTLLFVIMIADNSILYITDFSDSFIKLYDTSLMLYVVLDIIYILFILVSRLYIQSHFNEQITSTERKLLIALPILLMVLTYTLSESIGEGLTYFFFYLGILYLVYRFDKCLKSSEESLVAMEASALLSRIVLPVFVSMCMIGIVDSMLFIFGKEISILGNLDMVYVPFAVMKILICIAGLKHLLNVFTTSEIESQSTLKGLDYQVVEFANHHELTPRQAEIIKLIVGGSTNKEISETLHITEGTVKAHVYNIFKKTEVTSRGQLIGKILEEK